MGNELSEEQKRELEQTQLDSFVKRLKAGPDLRVNKNIVMFCSLSASDNLKQHYEKRKMEAGDHAADWIKSLVEKLGSLTPAPELAGLGALAIAVLIDITFFSPPEESTKEALRAVFAEEKASEVWDLIDECLKRCTMNIKNQDDLRNDIKRIEHQLSLALTKLKNSMVRDGHMSSPALKAWVNGAAFHIQMLIHLVRLGGIQTCDPVKNLLSHYEKDSDQLFEKHREIIVKKCSLSRCTSPCCPLSVLPYGHNTKDHGLQHIHFLVDENSEWHYVEDFTIFHKYVDAYYDHKYMSQKREIQKHVSEVRENLQSLILQKGFFKV